MPETKTFSLNKRTQNIIKLMLAMVDLAHNTNKKLVISCGLGLDIEAASKRGDNELTRNHGDLDVHPLEEDIPFWKEWFKRKGYSIGGNDEIIDLEKAFVAYPPTYNEELWDTDPGSYYVDVYGIMSDENSMIHTRMTKIDDNWLSTWGENFIECHWRGREITVMRHEVVLLNKRKTARELKSSLREKDIHDHDLFNIKPD